MNSETSTFPPPAQVPNLWNAFWGLWYLTSRRFFTIRYWIVLLGFSGLLFFIGTRVVAHNAPASEFVSWATGLYLNCLVPILSFISCAGALRDDLKGGVGDYLFTRPVRRDVFLCFRYVTQMLAIQFDFLFMFGVMMGVGVVVRVQHLASVLPVLLGAQILLAAVFASLGILCAVLTSRYVVLGILYVGIVEMGLGSLATQVNQIAMTPHVTGIVNALIPALTGASASISKAGEIAGHLLWLGGFLAAALSLSAFVFSRQERSGARAQET